MPLVSMKDTNGDDNALGAPIENGYPYGLRLYLNEEQVEKLGLSKNPPAAGSVLGLQAAVVVCSMSQSVDPNSAAEGEGANEIEVCLTLQITDMEIMGAQAPAKSLYES